MFHIALDFIIFPVAEKIKGGYPVFFLLGELFFFVAYYLVLSTNHLPLLFFFLGFLFVFVNYCFGLVNKGFN